MTLSWFFEDERTPAADAVLEQIATEGAVVPSLWRLETANSLQVAIRRRLVDAGFRDRALSHLARFANHDRCGDRRAGLDDDTPTGRPLSIDYFMTRSTSNWPTAADYHSQRWIALYEQQVKRWALPFLGFES